MKSLEALETLLSLISPDDLESDYREEIELLTKDLEAFEIIKKNACYLHNKTLGTLQLSVNMYSSESEIEKVVKALEK